MDGLELVPRTTFSTRRIVFKYKQLCLFSLTISFRRNRCTATYSAKLLAINRERIQIDNSEEESGRAIKLGWNSRAISIRFVSFEC